MSGPDDPFPRDSEGKRFGGPFKWIETHHYPAAVKMGWRPLPLTDKYPHPVTEGRGILCGWFGDGPMRLPEEA
jgi:hypothetical protein